MIRALRTGFVLLLVAVPVAEAHAATWGPGQRVSAPGERVVASAIAANARGQAVVAYRVDPSLPQAVHVRRRARGGRLGATQVLRASPFWTASSPAVAIDARGGAIVAWAESLRSPTGVATRIAAARAAPGRLFGRPVVVATAGADPPSGVRTAIVPGGAVVAWTTNASTGAAVVRRTGGWSAQSFGDDATGELLALAARRDGGAEAAWSVLERGTVVPAVSLAGLAPGAPAFGLPRRLRGGGRGHSGVRLAFTRAGEAIVAMVDAPDNVYADDRNFGPVAAKVRRGSGPFAPAVRLSEKEPRSGAGDRGPGEPALASAGGRTVLAWHRIRQPREVRFPLTGRIVARWRPDRGRFAAAVRLSQPGWVAVSPSAAVTALGAGAVAWQETRYDDLSRRTRVLVATLRPGRGWTAPTTMPRARAPQLVPIGERLLLTRLRPRSVLELVEGRP